MYGTPFVSNSLSFGKILGGLSKTLSIANQVIPLYQQAKPIIGNLGTTMNALKAFTSTSTKNTNSVKKNSTTPIQEPTLVSIANPPTFFM